MDKVEKIKEKVERLIEKAKQGDGEYFNGAWHTLITLTDFIDSLEEEPVSEGLEEAANKIVNKAIPPLAVKYKDGTYVGGIRDYFDRKEFIDLVKAGAEWQKSQGVTEEAVIGITPKEYFISISQSTVDALDLCAGDKVIVQLRKK